MDEVGEKNKVLGRKRSWLDRNFCEKGK